MFWGKSPAQSSAPTPLFCAQCGFEADPAAWLCATCGKSLHEPGAMTSVCPGAPATSRRVRPTRAFAERIYPLLIVLGFFVVCEAADPKHPVGWGLFWAAVGFVVSFWADGFFYLFR
jgi:hypothetical protein